MSSPGCAGRLARWPPVSLSRRNPDESQSGPDRRATAQIDRLDSGGRIRARDVTVASVSTRNAVTLIVPLWWKWRGTSGLHGLAADMCALGADTTIRQRTPIGTIRCATHGRCPTA